MWEDDFDIITTNPPFGSKLKIPRSSLSPSDDNTILEYSVQKNPKSYEMDLFFCVKSVLHTAGVSTMLVPEGVLDLSAYREFRRLMLERYALRAVVSVPPDIFHSATSVKTSVLMISRLHSDVDDKANSKVFMAIANEAEIEKDLAVIANSFCIFCEGKELPDGKKAA